ncbi:MAG TPA: DUF58 domain-containing protein [Nevskia sp.]|nr:DUF58 domain-containing protein [Nevskia sp.]
MGIGARLVRSGERFALILTQPFKTARRRIDAWIFTRLKRVPGPVLVSRRRVYILPTRYGYVFGLLLVVMLLGSMNYSNSMAFCLTFLLAGLGLVAMNHTHANLVDVQVRTGRVQPVFAGDTARFTLELDNPAPVARYALAGGWTDHTPQHATDLAPQRSGSLVLKLPAPQRGWLEAPRFSIVTEFPLGLFHAWTWIELDMACLVYPRPAPRGERPPATSGGAGARAGQRAGQEEFAGLRSYQRGDAMRSIHWKSLPKLQTPQVKQFAETLEKELWLDWDSLPAGWDVERRLSQLTRWVLDAESEGRGYGLRLPAFSQSPGRGELHRHECLKALALFEAPRR